MELTEAISIHFESTSALYCSGCVESGDSTLQRTLQYNQGLLKELNIERKVKQKLLTISPTFLLQLDSNQLLWFAYKKLERL